MKLISDYECGGVQVIGGGKCAPGGGRGVGTLYK